jgi:NAD(P)-dependent dehydrogenase (short-subunit alcohol dehydrogenase family)
MARRPVALVTGAGGEMGHALIHALERAGTFDVLAVDIRSLDPELASRCAASRVGDVLAASSRSR